MARGWTENLTISGFNNAALAAAAATSGDIDLAAAGDGGYEILNIQIKVVFGGSPDDDVTIRIYASPDSGTTDDSEPMWTFNIPKATGGTVLKSIPVEGVAFVKVEATNDDSADAVNVAALYAGWKAA